MKLTKEQRHSAYLIMLAELEWWNSAHFFKPSGFCRLADEIGLYTYGTRMEKVLPELYNKRPKKYIMYWFERGSWIKRKKLLLECIEETM